MNFYNLSNKPNLLRRITATVIDYLIYGVIVFGYVYVFGKEEDGQWTVTNLMALPVLLFWILYFVLLESINNATPGHDLMKLKVVKLDGSDLDFADAFKRRICDLFDFGAWCLPALICVYKTARHQRIGDLLAGTIVVSRELIVIKEIPSFRD